VALLLALFGEVDRAVGVHGEVVAIGAFESNLLAVLVAVMRQSLCTIA
jgi:hypothetical protein